MNIVVYPTSSKADPRMQAICELLDHCEKSHIVCQDCTCWTQCDNWFNKIAEKSSTRNLTEKQYSRAMEEFEKISPRLI